MNRHVLVAYASEFGSTRQIAEIIAAELREPETSVDVRTVFDVTSLGGYQAVVVSSPIYNGSWLPEAVDFVRAHAAVLAQLPVAYFAVSMTMRDDSTESRQAVMAYFEPVFEAAPAVIPIDIGLFAGSLDYQNLPRLERLMFRLQSHLPPGDYRDWEAIAAWTAKLRAHMGHQRDSQG